MTNDVECEGVVAYFRQLSQEALQIDPRATVGEGICPTRARMT